ncbi:hypothetical protein [Nocardiopsis quinghaiensis]|uniref:hypothetical protein n=1 Tax=Nocardiopsis quinghaiensis TaxID=464995 RepID=UPI00123B326E|nr:hypothetical protein [Nocardiopsis quinghaiensis]
MSDTIRERSNDTRTLNKKPIPHQMVPEGFQDIPGDDMVLRERHSHAMLEKKIVIPEINRILPCDGTSTCELDIEPCQPYPLERLPFIHTRQRLTSHPTRPTATHGQHTHKKGENTIFPSHTEWLP